VYQHQGISQPVGDEKKAWQRFFSGKYFAGRAIFDKMININD
jgi:hypothetical protein